MEESKQVVTIRHDFKCPVYECDGYLRPTGVVYDSNPPLYPHQCNKCDYTKTFSDKKYPYITYE